MADRMVEFELFAGAAVVLRSGRHGRRPRREGDFGVLPRHSLLISGVRTGVIQVWNGNAVTDRIFVAGGFCEVTGARCTVLAEDAVRVDDIDRNAIEAELKDLREDAADAKTSRGTHCLRSANRNARSHARRRWLSRFFQDRTECNRFRRLDAPPGAASILRMFNPGGLDPASSSVEAADCRRVRGKAVKH